MHEEQGQMPALGTAEPNEAREFGTRTEGK